MIGHLIIGILLLIITVAGATAAAPDCSPAGMSRAELQTLRSQQFALPDDINAGRFLLQLLPCLGHPDPVLRDQTGYAAFASLLRAQQVNSSVVNQLRSSLLEILARPQVDEAGYLQPFAALVLAEVTRVDRIETTFSDQQFDDIVTTTAEHLTNLSDYRGFDQQQGWRHGVAHAADVSLQLVLNPRISKQQLLLLRAAITTQISPGSGHFYIYAEPDRLARPILYMAANQAMQDENWSQWFTALGDPVPFTSWNDIFDSQVGLARRHNLSIFARVIYISAAASSTIEVQALAAPAEALLKSLP